MTDEIEAVKCDSCDSWTEPEAIWTNPYAEDPRPQLLCQGCIFMALSAIVMLAKEEEEESRAQDPNSKAWSFDDKDVAWDWNPTSDAHVSARFERDPTDKKWRGSFWIEYFECNNQEDPEDTLLDAINKVKKKTTEALDAIEEEILSMHSPHS